MTQPKADTFSSTTRDLLIKGSNLESIVKVLSNYPHITMSYIIEDRLIRGEISFISRTKEIDLPWYKRLLARVARKPTYYEIDIWSSAKIVIKECKMEIYVQDGRDAGILQRNIIPWLRHIPYLSVDIYVVGIDDI